MKYSLYIVLVKHSYRECLNSYMYMCCIIYEFVRRHRKIAFKTLTIISLEHCQTWHELLSVVSNSWQKLQTFPLLPLVFELSKKWGQGNNAQLTKGGTVKSQWICTLSPNKWLSVISTPFLSRNEMKKKLALNIVGQSMAWGLLQRWQMKLWIVVLKKLPWHV